MDWKVTYFHHHLIHGLGSFYCKRRCSGSRKSTPREHNRAFHFLDQSKLDLFKHSHGFNISTPKYVFNEDYPIDPKTFGERLRKARIDAGLLIKEFAEFIGVTVDTVINWELRKMNPWRRDIRKKVNKFIEN